MTRYKILYTLKHYIRYFIHMDFSWSLTLVEANFGVPTFLKFWLTSLKSCILPWNGVKKIKITEENLSQICILCQLLRTKTLASGSKCIKHFFCFYHYLSYICWVYVVYLTRIVFLKYPGWLVWIFCAPNPLT